MGRNTQVMKPMAKDEAQKNASNIGVHPQALLNLRGKGDGYYRTRANPQARLIQVNNLWVPKGDRG